MDDFDIKPFSVGKCYQMCPQEELKMRQNKGLIHILETDSSVHKKALKKLNLTAAPKRTVKCFQRSAAGKDLCNPNSLRPPDVLFKTVNYLLTEVVLDKRVPWYEVYNFICDRLRAVRQDVIIQQPSPEDCIKILEPIVRFHVYSGYRLFEMPLSEFDPKLNNNHLLECLKQILILYDITKCSSENRSEMESLYQISNLGSSDVLIRGLSLPCYTMNDDLKLAIELSLAWYTRNYRIIFKKFKLLSPLLQACLALHLPEIRRYVLQVMSVAYSCKNVSYPLDHLAGLLLYDDVNTLQEECHFYKIDISNNRVKFMKGSFDSSKKVFKRKTKHVTEVLNGENLPEILFRNNFGTKGEL